MMISSRLAAKSASASPPVSLSLVRLSYLFLQNVSTYTASQNNPVEKPSQNQLHSTDFGKQYPQETGQQILLICLRNVATLICSRLENDLNIIKTSIHKQISLIYIPY